ncbi:hypothetical protein [Streptomyces sp. NBC_00539]|uniref:hypothetical protein n=1 Tax=Streptomyces sp. NBC_00539 TaxID=2975770 RepID=UPI002E803429|nr:hypothetical protein [Streptomyces sp. NBC_00539]WUC62766.1 hypothetical protein OG861_00165 [Streptomyces sp. NBC_00539]
MPQIIVVSPPGSGTGLLNQATTALGYTPHGTMSAAQPTEDQRPVPGETYPLLLAGYGQDEAVRLLHVKGHELQDAFQAAVSAAWRVWWMRLGQPVTHACPLDTGLEARLSRLPAHDLYTLLPGRGCWYLTCLDLARADADFLRTWHTGGHPKIVYHHRDIRDRIIHQIRILSQPPADPATSMPGHLVYHRILGALPTLDAKITLALSDPNFPGLQEARRSRWLLHHPEVCVIRHEDLAGPALGGSTQARDKSLARLHAAAGNPDSTPAWPAHASPAGDKDDVDTLSVGAWRTCFTPAHERLLEQCHSDLLTGPAQPVTSQPNTPAPHSSLPAARGNVRDRLQEHSGN